MNNKQAKRLRRLRETTGLSKKAVKRAYNKLNHIDKGMVFRGGINDRRTNIKKSD